MIPAGSSPAALHAQTPVRAPPLHEPEILAKPVGGRRSSLTRHSSQDNTQQQGKTFHQTAIHRLALGRGQNPGQESRGGPELGSFSGRKDSGARSGNWAGLTYPSNCVHG